MYTPKLDRRDRNDILEQLRTLAASYVPEWRWDDREPDVGVVLAHLYAAMMENTISRYNKTSYNYYLTFLNMIGTKLRPASEASGMVKSKLKKLGYNKDAIRRVAIAMYEAEINMVIHADGGVVDVDIYPDKVEVVLADKGPGIPDVEKAMQEGYSTAPDNVRNLGFGAGMGLPNIKKYTDEMKIETTLGVGTTMYLTVLVKQ